MVYRSMGDAPMARIGAGIMDKAGMSADHTDYDAGTWSLVYVLRGRGTYRDADGTAYALGPGWCFQRVPGRRHTTVIDPASRWLEAFIDCGVSLAQALQQLRAIPVQPPAWEWGLRAERVARFGELAAELADAGERRLPALLVRLLALAVEAMPGSPERHREDAIDRACRLLAEEAGARLDLRTWCRREGLDYERFRKDFQRRLGVPPGQYRIRRRLDRACALLQSTDRSIADIATELGYATPYEFSAQFRARLGRPPSAYRARR